MQLVSEMVQPRQPCTSGHVWAQKRRPDRIQLGQVEETFNIHVEELRNWTEMGTLRLTFTSPHPNFTSRNGWILDRCPCPSPTTTTEVLTSRRQTTFVSKKKSHPSAPPTLIWPSSLVSDIISEKTRSLESSRQTEKAFTLKWATNFNLSREDFLLSLRVSQQL